MDELARLAERVRLLEDGLWILVNDLLADEEESDVVAATESLRERLEQAALLTLETSDPRPPGRTS